MEDHEKRLVFMCGNYATALQTPAGESAQLIGQTTETGEQMLVAGRMFYKELPLGRVKYVFSNNDHFFSGIRLAVKNGDLTPDEVEFCFYPTQHEARAKIIEINKDGRFEYWPVGFFDAYDTALRGLLK